MTNAEYRNGQAPRGCRVALAGSAALLRPAQVPGNYIVSASQVLASALVRKSMYLQRYSAGMAHPRKKPATD